MNKSCVGKYTIKTPYHKKQKFSYFNSVFAGLNYNCTYFQENQMNCKVGCKVSKKISVFQNVYPWISVGCRL